MGLRTLPACPLARNRGHMQPLAHSVLSHLRRLLTRRDMSSRGVPRGVPRAGSHALRNEERVMRIRTAVIPAAGLGTRMLPATKAVPKEMLPLADVPTIQYIVEEAVDSGIEHVVIVTNESKRAIQEYFAETPDLRDALERKGDSKTLELLRRIETMARISYVYQHERRGLGHA